MEIITELMTVQEAAALYRVKVSTFRTWINRKQIPESVYKKIGETIRIKKPQFLEFINS